MEALSEVGANCAAPSPLAPVLLALLTSRISCLGQGAAELEGLQTKPMLLLVCRCLSILREMLVFASCLSVPSKQVAKL